MITRIEIDGFKSFLDFKLDVPPFLALVGPNSSGKSNLFDAVEYEQDARDDPEDALLQERRGRPYELFHRVAEGDAVEAFEVRVEWLARSAAGFAAIASCGGATLENGRPTGDRGPVGLLDIGEQRWATEAVRKRQWRTIPEQVDEPLIDDLFDFFHRLSACRSYVPDPQMMRRLSSVADRRPLHRDGSNLAAVLGRMRDTEAFADLTADLVALVPDVQAMVPELDAKRQEWSFDLVIDGQGAVPSTLLSDGTLRILGLLAALHDPDHAGTLMVEEIENGLHPGRLAELLRRIQERVTDLSDPESLNRPLRQVILTSHSPVVVSELYRMRPDSLVFMDTVVRVDPEHDRVSRVTVAKPVRESGEPGTYVSPRQVRRYLGTVRQEAP
ncbi:AAA family ATPase [Actinomadura parmotrematis]|uniref:AAA family ATPase n=1 Tax=Actinomadura parmotrematis TaxID=2864039 RepID=A0ABS7FW49_9ACTN|nr:ATP-binding protein [Actinomadura parmotrematis]MBW8484496.1 AAA family ATPase [Actinomadura parmotrematis]